jgi:hypothetical protein
MIGSKDINFYFLGNRNYVNGLSIFEEILKTYLNDFGSGLSPLSKIKTFKINKFVRNNSWIEVYNSEDVRNNPKIRKASARIDFLTFEDQISILLFEKKGEPVKSRLKEYDRGQYLAKLTHFKDDSSVAEIVNFNDSFDFMRGIVEANFRFVNKKAAQLGKQAKSSWAYLINFDFFDMTTIPSKLTVHFKFDNSYEAYERYFIIRKLRIEKLQNDSITEMCFFI